jgi:hypothetical protein
MNQYYVTRQHKDTGEIVVWLVDEDRLIQELKSIMEGKDEFVSVIPVNVPEPILT